MMKKCLYMLFLSITVIFVVFTNNLLVAADISSYTVYSIKKDGTKTQIGEMTTDYQVAKDLMNNYSNSISDVAVIYKGDKLVNAYYGVVTLNSSVINIFSDATLTKQYTYTHGYYGKDAAFLDYDTNSDSIKIRISGYTGFISASNATVIPLSSIAKDYVMIEKENTYLNSSHTNGRVLMALQHKGSYLYSEKTTVNGEVWYHIVEGNINGWVKSDRVTEEVRPLYNTFYVRFNLENNNNAWDLYHYYEYGNTKNYNYLNLGIAPAFLNKNQYYYSFDGNYFYDNFVKMLQDYKSGNYKQSINSENPYYNYYMYLPNHSLSSYSGSDFDSHISLDYNEKPDSSYVSSTGSFTKTLPANLSQLYGEGTSFVEVQDEYGINALITYAVAKNESGSGRSEIAIAKNNLFGHGAYDSCPFNCAISYKSVKDSIIAHATNYMDNYVNPKGIYYYGGHYGNKGSGMGVKYASDPYWGEKMAKNAYAADISIVRRTYQNKLENFSAVVGQDYLANTIGIKLSNEEVAVKKEPSINSDTIYLLKNNYYNFSIYNMPLIVTDKVTDSEGNTWYKVRTDVGLDESKNLSSTYNFNTSYGYVLDKYLYVSNNQPEIKATDFEIDQGSVINLLENISATDLEDGTITDKITYLSSIDSNKVGVYDVTYMVTDSMGFNSSKTVKVTVVATSTPVINATSTEIKQYSKFDLLSNVTAFDSIDGDITSKIKVESDLNTDKVGVYKITYRVTNSLNVETVKEIKITVLSNSKPVIYASDIYVSKNKTITFKESVQVIDLEDGILDVTIESNATNLSKVGVYDLVYSATDSDQNKVTKNIKVYVEEEYQTLKGEFQFGTFNWNQETNSLDLTGSLAIIGIDNTKQTDIKYDFILKNNTTGYETVLRLERYLDNHPTTVYLDNTKKYEETWFKGSINLSSVPKGEYTLYVRAISGNYEAKELVSNIFLKPYTRKATDSNGRGYLFRNNNYKREFPLELIINNSGLITKVESTHPSNMFNTFDSIVIKDKYLNIIGNSFNMGGDYSSSKNITRNVILENIITEKRYTYNIGSIVGGELILKGNDGLSKAKSWYNTESLIDISTLEKGTYVIYFRTAVDAIDDFGELQDVLLKVNQTVSLNGKTYVLTTNKDFRYRVELTVK